MPILMAIGGAIKLTPPTLLQDFIQRAGGAQARITILPTASSLADTGEYYQQHLLALGLLHHPTILQIHQRSEAFQPDWAEMLSECDAVFIAGGNQLRLAAILGGTPVEAGLLQAYQRGAVIAGTSAGAAILSTTMLTYGDSGKTPRHGMAQFTPGLGFTDQVIFDQHFRQRDRMGRLLYAVANHPGKLGVGVDENTAAVMTTQGADRRLEVVGQHALTIVDGQSIRASNVAELSGHAPVAISGATIHVLTHGCTFDLVTRRANIPIQPLLVE